MTPVHACQLPKNICHLSILLLTTSFPKVLLDNNSRVSRVIVEITLNLESGGQASWIVLIECALQ